MRMVRMPNPACVSRRIGYRIKGLRSTKQGVRRVRNTPVFCHFHRNLL